MPHHSSILLDEPVTGGLRLRSRLWRRRRTLKADTWAANHLLEDEEGRFAVLKVLRFRPHPRARLAIPLPALADHEAGIYRRLAAVRGVPPLLGRPTRYSLLHGWVPGVDLAHLGGRELPEGFLDALEALLREIHRLGVAYVDLEKRSNILLGEDGAPHLVDFQIAVGGPRWLAERLAAEDLRHLDKHRLRLSASAGDDEALRERIRGRSLPLRLHRALTRPYFKLRRRVQAPRP